MVVGVSWPVLKYCVSRPTLDLNGLDTLGSFFRYFRQGRQFCHYPVMLYCMLPCIKSGLLYKERICFQKETLYSNCLHYICGHLSSLPYF